MEHLLIIAAAIVIISLLIINVMLSSSRERKRNLVNHFESQCIFKDELIKLNDESLDKYWQIISELKQSKAELFNHKQMLDAQIKHKDKVILERIKDIETLEFEIKKRLSHNDLLVKRNFDMQKEIDSLDSAVNEYAGQVYRLEKEKARS